MTAPELKPCLFCGSSDLEILANVIDCVACGAPGPMQEGREFLCIPDVAIAAWNHRADLPATRAQIAASPEVRALHSWAEDAQEALISAMEEIVELRLTLGKSDLEPPWLSDAIDQSRAALAEFKAMEAGE